MTPGYLVQIGRDYKGEVIWGSFLAYTPATGLFEFDGAFREHAAVFTAEAAHVMAASIADAHARILPERDHRLPQFGIDHVLVKARRQESAA